MVVRFIESGSAYLVGGLMIARLIEEGHDVCELTRTPPREPSALLTDEFGCLPGPGFEPAGRVGDPPWPR